MRGLARASRDAALVASAAIALVGAFAGAVRVLPWLLDPAVPWRVAAPFRQLMNAVFPRMPEGDVRVYSGAELTALLEAAGYRVTRCEHAGVRGQLLVASC